MANEISSQITSTLLNQTRTAEPAARPALAAVQGVSNRQATVESVDNRQETAAAQSEQALFQTVEDGSSSERTQLEQAVSDINDYVQTVNRELQFRVDDALPLGRSVVTVIDADTEEKIREFPSEEALALAHHLKEQAGEAAKDQIEGLIISARA